jgi:hypothetical protein
MIPFVADQYDSESKYHIDDWQRIFTFEDFRDKVIKLRDPDFFKEKLEKIQLNFEQALLSKDEYYKAFSNLMNRGLKI